ncbi:MAG: hypothetical protein KI792_02670 [Alphaproteobacteria bacterium]|nr:hypothetical protein [Alphaproteobacteria bacterium SS10]
MRTPRRKSLRNARQRGLTLTDTILVLVISGILISGVGILFLRGLTDTKTNVGFQQFISMQKSVRELYSGSANFAGLDNTVMDNSGFVPPDIKTTTVGEFRNTWGGEVIVETNGGTPDRFDIAFEGVPSEACSRIISYSGNQTGTTDGLDSIIVTANGSDTTFSSFPTDVAAVVAACDDGSDEATMRWVLY